MLDRFLDNREMVIYTIVGLVGFIWAYFAFRRLSEMKRARDSVKKEYEDILNSEEYKVKGRFEA
jgi:type III secretory pathway component EscU